MASLTGGCNRCSRVITVSYDVRSNHHPIIICRDCYEKYYSPESIRDKKLEKLLKSIPLWKRLNIFKVFYIKIKRFNE